MRASVQRDHSAQVPQVWQFVQVCSGGCVVFMSRRVRARAMAVKAEGVPVGIYKGKRVKYFIGDVRLYAPRELKGGLICVKLPLRSTIAVIGYSGSMPP